MVNHHSGSHHGGGDAINRTSAAYLDAMGIDLWQEKSRVTNSLSASSPSPDILPWQLSVGSLSAWLANQVVAQQQNLHNPSSTLLIVSDWQPVDEQTQCPFAGEPGDLLDAMLKAIDLRRDQVALVGLPRSADTAPADTGRQRISGVLAERSFKLILFMCTLPQSARPEDFVARDVAAQTCSGVPLILSFHPAYLLLNPAAKRHAWQDLKQARSLLGQ